jgi:hypothetical protein
MPSTLIHDTTEVSNIDRVGFWIVKQQDLVNGAL